jgi:nucleoside-triphosphatase THEP1
MYPARNLSETWIKASITGTLWAASEIVLGSFLHNLRIPFSGNLLTAIGIIILISVSYTWKEKGLFWRAGVICALMKTLSPSAVIFGPMIAIFSEAFLLEASVRILGKGFAGYLLGGMLAMSWNLFQRIMNFIIFYGTNIVDLYADLLRLAQKQLGIRFDIVWLPILILLVAYCIFGIIAVLIGMKVGRKILEQEPVQTGLSPESEKAAPASSKTGNFSYSLTWLFTDILMMAGSLVLLNFLSWIYWAPAITAVTVIWAARYKRALRQLSKPGFWIFFVLITMATSFIFVRAEPGSNALAQGFLNGLQMNFRAVVIILGFSVLGTELYNPSVKNFFLKTSFKQLPLALELSFESLPSMISRIPEFKTVVRNPVSVFSGMICQAEARLSEIRKNDNAKIILLTGSAAEGKTTFLIKLVEMLKKKGIEPGGILSPRVMEGETTVGYDVINIATGEREKFLRRSETEDLEKIGRFSIFPQGLNAGREALNNLPAKNQRVIIIDEAGKLEIDDGGWAADISNLIKIPNCLILLSVRDKFADAVIQKWGLEVCYRVTLSGLDPNTITDLILQRLY